MSRTERRQRIIEITQNAQLKLHWNAWKDRHPEAAALALPKIRDIIDEEMTKSFRQAEPTSSPLGISPPSSHGYSDD